MNYQNEYVATPTHTIMSTRRSRRGNTPPDIIYDGTQQTSRNAESHIQSLGFS